MRRLKLLLLFCILALAIPVRSIAAPDTAEASNGKGTPSIQVHLSHAEFKTALSVLESVLGKKVRLGGTSITGTVTITSDAPLTQDEVHEGFITHLSWEGFVIKGTEGFGCRYSLNEDHVTRVFVFSDSSASKHLDTVYPSAGRNTVIHVTASGRCVVVSDLASVVDRIEQQVRGTLPKEQPQ